MSAPEGLGSVISDAIQSAKELSAAAFIGYGVSTVAYGISVVQVYLYFRNYPKDSIFLKLTVAALWTLDTLSSIAMSHALYTLYVLNFNNLFADAQMPWILYVPFFSPSLYGVLPLSLQTRIFLTAIYADLVSTLLSIPPQSMVKTYQSTGLVCDITVTTSLIYYLRSRKAAGVRSTRDMIDSLIMHAMSRGILTAVCLTMLFILDIAYPTHFYWIPFYELLGKLYVNSILATLNVRTSVRGKGQLEVSTRSALRVMEFASGSGFTPRSGSKTTNSGVGSGVCGLAQFYVWLQSFSSRKSSKFK
ncbi:hypothetical protein GGX14DRAFT_694459 [Mycena pura]|uniref:DUF6534 domain-containing protein n=1 Tax=Mycena pura TaxID=153505 RepID=A0AAD6VT57_9AGAR|nr:hypothetical protein GGX14DRAFT_694459 [Mycena pura]